MFKVTGFDVIPKMGKTKTLIGSNGIKLFSSNSIAIGFGVTSLLSKIEPKKVTLYGSLSDNYFNGEITHQIEFQGIESENIERIRTPLADKLSAMAQAK